jgi:hypothetical protein
VGLGLWLGPVQKRERVRRGGVQPRKKWRTTVTGTSRHGGNDEWRGVVIVGEAIRVGVVASAPVWPQGAARKREGKERMREADRWARRIVN